VWRHQRARIGIQKLSDDQLRAKTEEFRARIQEALNILSMNPMLIRTAEAIDTSEPGR